MPSSQTQLMAVRFLSYSTPQHTQLEQGKLQLCVTSSNKHQSGEQVTQAAKATDFALLTSQSEQTAEGQGIELPCQSNNQLFARGQKTISKFGLNYSWSGEKCLLVKIKGQGCFENREAEQDFTCSQAIEMYSSTDGKEFKVTSLAM